jgi:phage gp36-like protein
MSYTYIDNVREWIPQVTSEYVSDESVAFFINVAEDDINDALRSRYEVPFLTVPTSIANLTARYAAYLILQTFPDENSTEDLERTGNELATVIEGYQTGRLSLGDNYLSSDVMDHGYFYQSDFNEPYEKVLIET